MNSSAIERLDYHRPAIHIEDVADITQRLDLVTDVDGATGLENDAGSEVVGDAAQGERHDHAKDDGDCD